MTTFNGELFLREQLNSILNQTFSDFELIICDDCSTDNTLQIIKEYVNKDKRIKLTQNTKNLGFKKNFEQAIGFCTGDYIALCDQDDVWEANHLETLLYNIGKNYLIAGNNELVDSHLFSLYKDFFSSHLFSMENFPSNLDILKKIILSGNCFQGASMLLKKDILMYYLPLPEDIPYHDSWLAALACSINKFTCVESIITKYRQHNKQVTHTDKNNNDFTKKRIVFCKELLKHNELFDNKTKNFIEQAEKYFKTISSFWGRIKQLRFWNQNYCFLFPDMNKYKKTIRLLKFILFLH